MLMQISEGANPITSFRRTLDVWSLTAEDFGVLSIHDTAPSLVRKRHVTWSTLSEDT